MDERVAANRANWDDRVPIHLASRFYDVEGWLRDRPGPPAWERPALGEVAGLEVVHLQCHIGLDTLALADAGARVTGLDISPAAIGAARSLAERAGLTDVVDFVEGDVLEAATLLAPRRFDLVYVSLGALCWLPSVHSWAAQAATLLRPGGRLHLHDVHPLSWAFADESTTLAHSYFEEPEPFVDDTGTTYTDGGGTLTHPRTYEWNHSVGELVSAVLDEGLVVHALDEHAWTVFPRFDWLEPTGDGRWRCPAGHPRFPLSLTLGATKPVPSVETPGTR